VPNLADGLLRGRRTETTGAGSLGMAHWCVIRAAHTFAPKIIERLAPRQIFLP